jgi:hypothetical protein
VRVYFICGTEAVCCVHRKLGRAQEMPSEGKAKTARGWSDENEGHSRHAEMVVLLAEWALRLGFSILELLTLELQPDRRSLKVRHPT